MPNSITHYTFAKEKAIGLSPLYFEATFLGSQGPDPWFYYGTMGKIGRPFAPEANSLGSITQHMEITEPYWAFISYAAKSEDKDLLFAYIDGLFMHYSLDRTCHPFVFYNTGFTDREEDSKATQHHYNYGHMCFEGILDYLVGKKKGTLRCPSVYLRIKKKYLLAISLMWYEVNKEVQKVKGIEPDSFLKAVYDFRRVQRLAYSPLGLKKRLFGLLCGKESYPHGLPVPSNLKGFEGCDFLNDEHAEWYTPSVEPKHESFYDLYDEAGEIYAKLHDSLEKAKEGKDEKEEIREIGAHINHEGIIPNSPKIYWKLIWPSSFLKDTVPHLCKPEGK